MLEDQFRARIVPAGISTDDIIPARYKHMHTDPRELAPHVFENRFPGMASTLAENDAIVGLGIFGIGSSREQAVSSLLACGVKLVVAPAFGRIFFRNAWNLGLIAIEADTSAFSENLKFKVDLKSGFFSPKSTLPMFSPPAQRMLDMVAAGGLLPFILKQDASLEEASR